MSEQPDAGETYWTLKPVIGIHLLDFALFDQPEHAEQALWCFELRDRERPEVRLGRELQLNIVELRKADRLGQLPERLSAWIAYFKHWREDSVMNRLTHPPVQQALGKLRSMSADEEARYWAEAREKALRDEATLLDEARAAGLKEGEQKGIQEARLQSARAMLQDGQLKISAIAHYTGLSEDEVRRLADSLARH